MDDPVRSRSGAARPVASDCQTYHVADTNFRSPAGRRIWFPLAGLLIAIGVADAILLSPYFLILNLAVAVVAVLMSRSAVRVTDSGLVITNLVRGIPVPWSMINGAEMRSRHGSVVLHIQLRDGSEVRAWAAAHWPGFTAVNDWSDDLTCRLDAEIRSRNTSEGPGGE